MAQDFKEPVSNAAANGLTRVAINWSTITQPLADQLQRDLKYLPNASECDQEGLFDCLMEQNYNAFNSGYAPWDDKVCAPKFGCELKPSMEAMKQYLAHAQIDEASPYDDYYTEEEYYYNETSEAMDNVFENEDYSQELNFERALEKTANQLGNDLGKAVMQQQDNIAKYAKSFVAECNLIMKEVYKCDPVCADNCSSDFTRFDPEQCSRCACEIPFKVSAAPNFYETAHSLKYKQLKALSSKAAYTILVDEAKPEAVVAVKPEAGAEAKPEAFNKLYVIVPAIILALGGLGFFLYKKNSSEAEGGSHEDLYTKFLEC